MWRAPQVRFDELLADDGTHKLEEWAPLDPVPYHSAASRLAMESSRKQWRKKHATGDSSDSEEGEEPPVRKKRVSRRSTRGAPC